MACSTASPTGDGNDNGTIFEVNTSGVERVLYNFKGGTDGANPYADLIAANGVLYGTTARGGANNAGTVLEVSKAGVESVLHSFGSGTDGSIPYGRLADVNGALYGTTAAGGASGYGTVFAVSASGAERVLHSFQGSPDGAVPYAGLVFGSSVTATHSRAVRPSTSSAVLDRGAIPRSRRVPASVARTIACSVRRVVPRGAMHHGDRQVRSFRLPGEYLCLDFSAQAGPDLGLLFGLSAFDLVDDTPKAALSHCLVKTFEVLSRHVVHRRPPPADSPPIGLRSPSRLILKGLPQRVGRLTYTSYGSAWDRRERARKRGPLLPGVCLKAPPLKGFRPMPGAAIWAKSSKIGSGRGGSAKQGFLPPGVWREPRGAEVFARWARPAIVAPGSKRFREARRREDEVPAPRGMARGARRKGLGWIEARIIGAHRGHCPRRVHVRCGGRARRSGFAGGLATGRLNRRPG
jgi:uncharacterized repeat protein (TIGR03803 family)